MGEETIQKADAQQPEEAQEKKMPGSLAELLAELDREGIRDYRKYQKIIHYLNYKSREQAMPLHGTFEITPYCNFDCKMCYVHLSENQMSGKTILSVDRWKKLMRQAIEAGMMSATITGGECLTYDGFDELYLYLQSFGVEIAVLTNGSLLNDGKVEFFKNHPPKLIRVTLYGSTEEVYVNVTGCNAFNVVMNNIIYARKAGLPLYISITPNKFSIQDTKTLMLMLHKMKIPFILNTFLYEARSETGRHLSDFNITLDEYIDIAKFQAELQNESIEICTDEHIDKYSMGTSDDNKATGLRCGGGRNHFAISWDGVMYPCNIMHNISALPEKEGFSNAWKKISMKANTYPIPIECIGCSYEHICPTCVVQHQLGANIGHANPQLCEWGQRMVNERLIKP